mmetsp:Transcript_89819/g.228506  ORF Transcript_89819/g.228506 Transcript_89819/m.228506 type:complete len:83 (-) Transcript_89819:161-409(-)
MVGIVARVGDFISVGSFSRVVGIAANTCDRVPMGTLFRGRCLCLRSRMRRIVGIAGLTCHLGRVVGMVASVIICVRGDSGLV